MILQAEKNTKGSFNRKITYNNNTKKKQNDKTQL